MTIENLLIVILVIAFFVACYVYLSLSDIAFLENVSQEDYAQMAQQLVKQSIR